MRPLWLGAALGLVASPVVIGVVTLVRYIWPSFPLLRVLDAFASVLLEPIAIVTGDPVVLDAVGSVQSGLSTLLIAYGIVVVLWGVVGGLVCGAVWEQVRKPEAAA